MGVKVEPFVPPLEGVPELLWSGRLPIDVALLHDARGFVSPVRWIGKA